MKIFKLENTPKIDTGFKTPEDYFNNFSSKMMAQLPTEETKVISIFQRRKTILLMVAAVLVLALMIPIVSTNITASKELDAAAIENYITYQSNVNQYDLINGLETEDINNIKTGIVLGDKAIEDHLTTNSNLEILILE